MRVRRKLQEHRKAACCARVQPLRVRVRPTCCAHWRRSCCSRTICSPTGSIELEAIDNLGRITDEQILGCAAALTESAGLELGRVLTDTTKERFGITFTARDVRLVEERCNRRYRHQPYRAQHGGAHGQDGHSDRIRS